MGTHPAENVQRAERVRRLAAHNEAVGHLQGLANRLGHFDLGILEDEVARERV